MEAVGLFITEHPLAFTLIVFQGLDVFSGVAVAVNRCELSSSVSFKGLTRKIVSWLIVVACYSLQRHFPDMPLGDMACMVYIAAEGLSLLENAALIGVPLPGSFVDVLEKMRRDAPSKRRANSTINAEFVELTSKNVDQVAEHVHQQAPVVETKAEAVIVKARDTAMADIPSDCGEAPGPGELHTAPRKPPSPGPSPPGRSD